MECRTQQNWNLVWQGSFWQPHRPYDQPATPGWCRIDPGLGAATTRVPAVSREDSRPHAMLKFQPHNSLITGSTMSPSLNTLYVSQYKNSIDFFLCNLWGEAKHVDQIFPILLNQSIFCNFRKGQFFHNAVTSVYCGSDCVLSKYIGFSPTRQRRS